MSQNCQFPTVVAHGGGLPGLRHAERWLPEYGVGLIAFGNKTYTSWPRTFDAALDALARTGGLQPRTIEPSPALIVGARRGREARREVGRRGGGSDRGGEPVPRQSKERRAPAIDALHAQVGACTAGSGFDRVENALRGDWTMTCERGRLKVADHARADDAAEGAVPVRDAVAADARAGTVP